MSRSSRSTPASPVVVTTLLATLAAIVCTTACSSGGRYASGSTPVAPRNVELADIEAKTGGRLGVQLLDADGRILAGHRADERFAMCSTFKAALAGAILERVDDVQIGLDDMVEYGEEDLEQYAPVAREHVGEGQLSIADLARAAVAVSDNTAANLLLTRIGGPAGLTKQMRYWGDEVTRLDRDEPMLNENAAGDPRDTTSPAAMAETIRRLLYGDVLSAASRELLGEWMDATTTGARRIPAGLPRGWRAGHKTGTCGGDGPAYNDVARLVSPSGDVYVLAIYLDRPDAEGAAAEAALAQVTRELVARLE